jgi:hypothetical protein
MKTKSRNTIVALIVFSTTIFNGCKKGEDGAPGKDGSSNVTSYTYSISTWSYSSPAWYKNLSFPEITSANINTVSVQAYIYTATNTWTALPNTFYNSGGANYLMGFETTVGVIRINWIYNSSLSAGDNPNTFFGTSASQFKVVAIPPSIMIANPNLNLKDYNQVKQILNLKD